MNNQIEEMASDMDYGCTKRDLYPDDAKEIAKALYLLGYQKIDKDKQVVLTREEYERLKLELAIEKKRADESYTQKEVEEIIASKERIKSKETAEKILKDFKLWAREYQNKDIIIDDNGERPMTNNEKLNYLYTYLCDKYEVEIKE